MKSITRLTTLVLSSLLVLLGFGGCKASKKAAQKRAEELELQRMQQREDSLARERQIEQERLFRQRQQRDNEPMRLLYGPPVSRYLKDIDR